MLKLTIALALVLLAKMTFAALITPQDALLLATATPLEFKGKFAAPGSSTGRESCVFENRDTLVISDYCSTGDIPVAGIRVFPKDAGSSLTFYVETDGDPFSALRDSYDPAFWRVGVVKHPSGCSGSMSASDYPTCAQVIAQAWSCSILTIQPLGTLNVCDEKDESLTLSGADWLVHGREFWERPTATWYALLGSVKSLTQANL